MFMVVVGWLVFVLPRSWMRHGIVVVIVVVVVVVVVVPLILTLLLFTSLSHTLPCSPCVETAEDGEMMEILEGFVQDVNVARLTKERDERAAQHRSLALRAFLDPVMRRPGDRRPSSWRQRTNMSIEAQHQEWMTRMQCIDPDRRYLWECDPLPSGRDSFCEESDKVQQIQDSFWRGSGAAEGSFDVFYAEIVSTPVCPHGYYVCQVRRRADVSSVNTASPRGIPDVVFELDPRTPEHLSPNQLAIRALSDQHFQEMLRQLRPCAYGPPVAEAEINGDSWLWFGGDDSGFVTSRHLIPHEGMQQFQPQFLNYFVVSIFGLWSTLWRLVEVIQNINSNAASTLTGMAPAMLQDTVTPAWLASINMRVMTVDNSLKWLRQHGRIDSRGDYSHTSLSRLEELILRTVARVLAGASTILAPCFEQLEVRLAHLRHSRDSQRPVLTLTGAPAVATNEECNLVQSQLYALTEIMHTMRPTAMWLLAVLEGHHPIALPASRPWPCSHRGMSESMAHCVLVNLHGAMDSQLPPPSFSLIMAEDTATAIAPPAPPSEACEVSDTAMLVDDLTTSVSEIVSSEPAPSSSSSSSSSSLPPLSTINALSVSGIIKCIVFTFLAMISGGLCQPDRAVVGGSLTNRPPFHDVEAMQSAPSCPVFADVLVVKQFVSSIVARQGGFSVSLLHRDENRRMSAISYQFPAPKPHAMDIGEMFHPYYCGYGASLLPADDHPLMIAAFDDLHRQHCTNCRSLPDGIHPRCYYSHLRLCLTNGFRPPIRSGWLVPPYLARGAEGNHPSADQFRIHTAKAVAKLYAAGIVRPYQPAAIVACPIGVTIPNAKKQLAYSLTGINIVDDISFDAADAAIQARSLEPLKRRVIVDATAPGLNAMFDVRPFSYIDIHDFLQLIHRNDFIAIADMAAYFHSWPLAMESRPLFAIRYHGVQGVFGRLPFGGAPCPYLASTMTAEVCAGLRALGLDICAMVDDFAMRASSYDGALAALHLLTTTAERLGLAIAPDKTQIGQVVKFIGFLIDTRRMVVSFDPVSTQGFLRVLEQVIVSLAYGHDLDKALIVHIAGKLNHYASVLQAGKLHVSTLWGYLRARRCFSATGRATLLDDLKWWASRLRKWASGDINGGEFPIINAATLAEQDALLISSTDYSGPHGVGGYYGRLHDTNPTIFSEQWPGGVNAGPASSLAGELSGLRALVLHLLALPEPPCAKVLVWVTDNMGAAQSVNAGRCFDFDGMVMMRLIYEALETLGIVVVALWHDRIANTFSDYLSHLAFLCRKQTIITTLEGLGALLKKCRSSSTGERATSSQCAVPSVLGRVEGARRVVPTTVPPRDKRLSLRPCGQERREHSLPRWVEVKPENRLRAAKHPLAGRGGSDRTDGPHPTTEVRGLIRYPAGACTAHQTSQCDHRADVRQQDSFVSHSDRGVTPEGHAAGSHAGRGIDVRNPRLRRNLASEQTAGQATSPTHQDLAQWARSFRHARRKQRPLLRSEASAEAMAITQARRSSRSVPVPENHTGSGHHQPVRVYLRRASSSGQTECRPNRSPAAGVHVALA